MPAPPPMQFQPLQFAQSPSMGQALQGLGQSLTPIARQLGQPSPTMPMNPGSAVPGAQGPTSVGGPAGPAPLVQPGTTTPGQFPGPSPMSTFLNSLSPPQLLSWLQNATRTGQPLSAGLPGSAATQGAGMLPTMNNPSQFGG
jgi:hypothetical protein